MEHSDFDPFVANPPIQPYVGVVCHPPNPSREEPEEDGEVHCSNAFPGSGQTEEQANPPIQSYLGGVCHPPNPSHVEPEEDGEENRSNVFPGSGQTEEQDLNEPYLNPKRRELTNAERNAAYGMLLRESTKGTNRKGSTREIAELFDVSIRTIQRVWKRGKESGNYNTSISRVKNCGRKRIQFDMDRIREIPLRHRKTLKTLADAVGMSSSFMSSRLKIREIRRHSNAIRPTLTEGNRHRRLQYYLSQLDPSSFDGANPTFSKMENVIHIDEKWFHMTKKIQSYYLLADEDDPVRTIKSINFVPKLMFLAAVGRPRYDYEGICTFNGKVGVFPLVHDVTAIRSSNNRISGTVEVKAIPKIDRQVIRHFMINKIVPAIKDNWPTDSITEPIIIQQDNAKTHIPEDDEEFISAANRLGLNVKIQCQPPNSPDLNVLDLGFFRAIQSLQEKECATSIVQLVAAVEKSYWEFSDKKSNNIFLTHQACMIEVLKILGSNTYRIPHMKKRQLEMQGILPSQLSCDPLVVAIANAHCPQ